MSKNGIIYILVFLIIVCGIWGSLADRRRIALQKELKDTQVQMKKITEQTTKQREQVLGKTAGLQEVLAEKEEQLAKARKELVALRKEIKTQEAQVSNCHATLQKLEDEKKALEDKIKAEPVTAVESSAPTTLQPAEAPSDQQVVETDTVESTSESDMRTLREQLHTAELTIDRLRQRLNGSNAQIIGLEKLLEEKSAAMEETSQDMDRLKINMDVLLSKIADQRDELQELQEVNRDLVKELAAKNEEIADLQEEVMRQPVQE